MSVRHKEELSGSPGKTFIFHIAGVAMAVTPSCLPYWKWLLCQELWQPSCGPEEKARGVRGAGSGRLIVCSSCRNKGPWSEWLLNNRNLFRIILKAGCLSSGCQHGHVLVMALFQVTDCQLPMVTLHMWKGKTLLCLRYCLSDFCGLYLKTFYGDSTWYYIIWHRWVGKIFSIFTTWNFNGQWEATWASCIECEISLLMKYFSRVCYMPCTMLLCVREIKKKPQITWLLLSNLQFTRKEKSKWVITIDICILPLFVCQVLSSDVTWFIESKSEIMKKLRIFLIDEETDA